MAGKFALIIGNSEYQDPNLTRLKAPEADVEGLSALLRDPQIGAFDDVITLANELSFTIRRTIAHFFAEKAPEDLLVLYFSGHGVLDDRGELFLATKDTERKLISGTAIPAAYITGEMDRSRSKRQVLILDCCHSGAFARGSKGIVGASVGTASAFQGTGYGRVVLTATDATQFAWEGDQVIGSAENSLFTHYMIEGLRTGQADTDGDGRISIENLYDYVYEQVVKTTPKQTPGKWSYKQQGEIIIANNPKPATKPAELPRELREAIDDARPWVREGAVAELERLLNGRHPGLALAALEALKHLADDDSRRVASAATQVLNGYDEAKRVQEQAHAEQERLAREQAEAAREKEEQERLAREKAEQERVAKEKAEAERLAREQADASRIAREKEKQEWLDQENAKAAQAARNQVAYEQLAREKAEQERIAKEKAEAERLAREKAERVVAAPVAVPERKAVTAGTPQNRRPLFILIAVILVLLVFGIAFFVSRTGPVATPPPPAPKKSVFAAPPAPLLPPPATEWTMGNDGSGNSYRNQENVLCPPLEQVWTYTPLTSRGTVSILTTWPFKPRVS